MFLSFIVYPFTFLVDGREACRSCAQKGQECGITAGKMVRAAVRGRAGDELSQRSERGGEQRENAPAVGKSARARSIINRRGACAAGRRRETVARSRALSPALRVAVRCALFRRRDRVASVVQARCRLITVLAFPRFWAHCLPRKALFG